MKSCSLKLSRTSLRMNSNLDSTRTDDPNPDQPRTSWCALDRLAGVFCFSFAAGAFLLAANNATAQYFGLNPEFNQDGNTLISDQFNNRVIRIDHTKHILASYGLPLDGGSAIGNNVGYDLTSTQKGLYSPYDAKIIGDYTGLTPPFSSVVQGKY
jgi:hypothetical protein